MTRIVDLSVVPEATSRETVVVIDVLRAATTAAVALSRGAAGIRPVRTVEEALALREADPRLLLMGEVEGVPIPGFDLSNSPVEVGATDVEGRTLVHRTTAGTQGLVIWRSAEPLLFAGLLNARATASWLLARDLTDVTLVATGVDQRDGAEDLACADHIEALLRGGSPEAAAAVARVRSSDAARRFLDPRDVALPEEDLDACCRVDALDFAVVAHREEGALVLRGVRVEPVATLRSDHQEGP